MKYSCSLHTMTREELLAAYAAGQRDFTKVNLSEANLTGVNLTEADLTGADLYGVNLTGADLSGADLYGVNLTGADLSRADLSGADLYGVNLTGADLSGADLTGADLSRADLSRADLTGAIGFRFENAPDPAELRKLVADKIESHPELHNQREWGDGSANPECGTACCVAGWACHLGGGSRGEYVSSAAMRLLWIDGKPMPSFDISATREEILTALRA